MKTKTVTIQKSPAVLGIEKIWNTTGGVIWRCLNRLVRSALCKCAGCKRTTSDMLETLNRSSPDRKVSVSEERRSELTEPIGWVLSSVMDNGRVLRPVVGVRYGLTEAEAVTSFIDSCLERYSD